MPESVRVPDDVAGMVTLAVTFADGEAVGVVVRVAEGVATKAGKPDTPSAASTVKLRTIFCKMLFSSVYSRVRVCSPGSSVSGGVQAHSPFLSALMICVSSTAE